MKTRRFCCLLLALTIGFSPTFAAPADLSPELTALKDQYERDVAFETRNLRDHYISSLQKMLADANRDNHPNAAIAIQAELSRVAGVPGTTASDLVGTWEFRGKGWVDIRVFRGNGQVTAAGANGKSLGKWHLEKDRVVVDFDGGGAQTLFLPINPAGTKGTSAHGKDLVAIKQK